MYTCIVLGFSYIYLIITSQSEAGIYVYIYLNNGQSLINHHSMIMSLKMSLSFILNMVIDINIQKLNDIKNSMSSHIIISTRSESFFLYIPPNFFYKNSTILLHKFWIIYIYISGFQTWIYPYLCCTIIFYLHILTSFLLTAFLYLLFTPIILSARISTSWFPGEQIIYELVPNKKIYAILNIRIDSRFSCVCKVYLFIYIYFTKF